jgi:gustatory receptor
VGVHGANNCPSIRDPIKAYYITNYPQVFLIFPYSGALGTVAKALNIVMTFAWSFTDLFVIVVSIGLVSKFKQINEDLREVKGQSVHPGFWSEYRLYYREVSNLIAIIDDSMAKIILISVSNNLFFICVQLLRSLE